MDNNGKPLTSFAEVAHQRGLRVGSMSSVQWSHATPSAGGGAHNTGRGDYAAIANEMLDAGVCDVIMGCGHPEFDNAGKPVTPADEKGYQYVGGPATWAALKEGRHPRKWTLVQDAAEFEALAKTGQRADGAAAPLPLVGTAKAGTTLQQKRPGVSTTAVPGEVPLNANVPDLATMTRAALRLLDGHDEGMFLMVEGGAVDFAMHDNQLGHMVEEMMEFNKAVQAVVDWVDDPQTAATWDNTLVIITADHDHLLLGPNSSTVPFDELVDQGKGKLPGYAWQYNSHSNRLVPLYARGKGAQRLLELAGKTGDDKHRGTDPVRGKWVDDTDVFGVMVEAAK